MTDTHLFGALSELRNAYNLSSVAQSVVYHILRDGQHLPFDCPITEANAQAELRERGIEVTVAGVDRALRACRAVRGAFNEDGGRHE